jgi:putative PEP-CTERM system TPR-repeat lipoprotein
MSTSPRAARIGLAAIVVLAIAALVAYAMGFLGGSEAGPTALAGKYLAQAEAHQQAGEYGAALTAMHDAERAGPQSAALLLRLGQLYLDLGDGTTAAKVLEQARQLDPQAAGVRHPLGRAWLRAGAYARVLDELPLEEEAQASGRAEINILHGLAHLAQGDVAEARQNFEQALARQPGLSRAYVGLALAAIAAGDTQAVEGYLQSAQGGTEVEYVEILAAEGDLALARGNHQAAEDAFQRAVNLRPREPWRRRDLVEVQISSGKLDEASRTLEPVQPLIAIDPDLRYLAGLLAYRQSDFQRAADLAAGVLTDQPNRAPALFLAGASRHALGAYAEAREYLEPYLAGEPSDADARRLLASTYLELQEPARAYETLGPLAEGEITDVELLALLGKAAQGAGRLDDAQRHYRRAVELRPDDADLRARLDQVPVAPDEGEAGP